MAEKSNEKTISHVVDQDVVEIIESLHTKLNFPKRAIIEGAIRTLNLVPRWIQVEICTADPEAWRLCEQGLAELEGWRPENANLSLANHQTSEPNKNRKRRAKPPGSF